MFLYIININILLWLLGLTMCYVTLFLLLVCFRNRLIMKEETIRRNKDQSEAEYKGLVNRQKIMREFRERQLHCIEILPACKYLNLKHGICYRQTNICLFRCLWTMFLLHLLCVINK